MPRRAWSLSLSVLVGCGGNSLKADGLDLPLDTLEHAFVETDAYDVDANDDGAVDHVIEGIGVVITDREDLCGAGSLEAIDDVLAVLVIALSVDGPEVLEANASLNRILFESEPGDSFVGIRVLERRGGVVTADFSTVNLIDGDQAGSSSFWISSRSVNAGVTTNLGGPFDGVLQVDRTDPSRFNVDLDDDGVDDYASMNVEVKGRVSSAEPCTSLELLL